MASSASSIRAGRAYVELFADGRKLYGGLKQASLKLQAFGASVKEVGSKLMMIGGVAFAPLAAVAKLYGSMGDQLAHMSARTGVAVEVLSALSFAAQQSGVDVEELEMGIRKMQKTIVGAATGSQSAIDALGRLGLTVKDLDGLTPDEQFRLLAQRMSEVSDPTIRAALAMEIFGKSGTKLVPLLSLGAEGIARLEDQARRLGLVISTEDAEAAHKFNRLMETLWDLVKRAGFALGGALAPALSEVAKWLGGAVMALTEWIKNNRETVVLALKIVVGILAAGAALAFFGTVIGIVGKAMGVLFTVVNMAQSAFAVLGPILAGLLSPMGLVMAGAVALGGYLLYASGAGGKAVDWLSRKFTDLKDEAVAAIGGIGDALAAGDIGQAAKIIWLTLKMWWTKGTGWIGGIWQDALLWCKVKFAEVWGGIRIIFSAIGHGISVAWIETTAFMSKTWTEFCGWVQKAWAWAGMQLTKMWNGVKAIFDDSFDADAANKAAEAAYDAKKREIEAERDAKLKAREEDRAKQRDAETKEFNETLGRIVDETEAKKRQYQQERDDAARQSEEELDKARKEWQESIQAAKDKRKAKEAAGEGPAAMQPPEDLLDKAKKAVGNLGDLMEATAKRTIGAAGTFNAAALLGLQAGGMEDRVANAAERTAKGVEGLRQDVRNNKASFQ